MYKNVGSPDRDYEAEWLEAERELGLSGKPPSGEQEEFTRDDFMESLKRASRRIDKPKSSPKPSKT